MKLDGRRRRLHLHPRTRRRLRPAARRAADRRAVARRPRSGAAATGRRDEPADVPRRRPHRPRRPDLATWSAGVADADVVLLQLRVGGQAARHGDETWPHECGCIGQETTGPGGFAKALRTVPVVLGSPRRSAGTPSRTPGSSTSPTRSASSRARCCRRATAPSGSATSRSASSAGSRRCSDVAPGQVQLGHVGLNHLTWERSALVTDATGTRDVLPELLDDPAGAAGRGGRAARVAAAPARRRAQLLPALLLRPRRGAARAARLAHPRRGGAARWSANCWSSTPTRRSTPSRSSSRSAAARSTPRRPST